MPDDTPPDDASQPLIERRTALDTVLLAGGLVLFLVMLFEMHAPAPGAFLNPPLIAAAGVLLLWPLRELRAVRALALAAGLLLALWAIDVLSYVLLPFGTVYLLAYLFDPVVTSARARWGVPRAVSSLLVTAVLVGLLVLFFVLIVPRVVAEIETLALRLVSTFAEIRAWVATTTVLDSLDEVGIDKDVLILRINNEVQERLARLTDRIPSLVQDAIGRLQSVLGALTIAAILPVVLYYTLKDYPHIKRRLVELFPTFGGQRDYLVRAGSVVGGYLRGQLTISAIAAFNVTVALVLFDVPFALLIGIAAGVFNLIPNLGAVLTMVLGVLIAVVFGDPWFLKALTVVLVLLGQGLLEGSVLTPKILSSHVGLHPVLILLSLFVFAVFLGWFGLLIAVPTTALLMAVYKAYRDELAFELTTAASGGPPTPSERARTPAARARFLRRVRRRVSGKVRGGVEIFGDDDDDEPGPGDEPPDRPEGDGRR